VDLAPEIPEKLNITRPEPESDQQMLGF